MSVNPKIFIDCDRKRIIAYPLNIRGNQGEATRCTSCHAVWRKIFEHAITIGRGNIFQKFGERKKSGLKKHALVVLIKRRDRQ